MNKKIILTILIAIFFANQVDAVGLKLESEITEIKVDNQFKVDLVLNSKDESVNAIGSKIVFPQELVELKEVREGDSIINFWVEKPAVNSGTISFSGIIPGGYNDDNGLILSLIFKAKKQGNVTIYLNQSEAFKNDGLGTPVSLNISNINLYIRDYYQDNQKVFEIVDKDNPEIFVPEVSQSEDLFNNQYFLVFATQDKGVGIDHYEVCEGNIKICVKAESPYVLEDQSLEKNIYIKAIDKNGNERVVVLEAPNPLPWYKNYLFYVIILVLLFTAVFIKKLWKKLKKY